MSQVDLAELIDDDRERGTFRYRRDALTSYQVLDLEWEEIFATCWLYLGHDSELPNTGDYIRREIAGRPLFAVRNRRGDVRAFYNTCTHRGARICRKDSGTGKVFQCFYHAWSFNLDGKLIGVPDEGGFGAGFNKADFGLQSPRHESHRGFHFVNFDPDAESLADYLGGAAEYLDLLADQSTETMRVLRGSNLYAVNANWKTYVENSLDGYHFDTVHQTYAKFLSGAGANWTGQIGADDAMSLDLGHGHVVIDIPTHVPRPVACWGPSMPESVRPEIEATRRRLVEIHGEERAVRIADRVQTLLVYPNLLVMDMMAPAVRTIWPGPTAGECSIRASVLAPSEESPEMLAVRLRNIETFLGAGGFGTPDDVEAVEACQQGFAAREVVWSDISRGIGRPPYPMYEHALRTFWRQWHRHLLGDGPLAASEADREFGSNV